MALSTHIVNITASDSDKFKIVEDALKTLPEHVYEQITDAAHDGHFGVRCTIGKFYIGTQERIYLPNDVTQINDEENQTTIYHPNFLFIINKSKFYGRKHFNIILTPNK
jgi:hypothetical protein